MCVVGDHEYLVSQDGHAAIRAQRGIGDQASRVLDDEWTVATVDGSLAAHFEHTFTLTPNGAWILTAIDGGEAKLAELGVPFGPLAA